MNKLPEKLAEKEVARSRLFRVQAVDLRFSNGQERQYEYLASSHFKAVAVVALFENGDVLLIKEYAAGQHRYALGLPKGMVEADESYEQGANRELKEETGYGAHHLACLKALSLSPAYMSHETQIVLATDLYPEKLEGDEPEPIECLRWPLEQLDELIARADFTEARSIAALYMARDWWRKR